MRLDIALVNGFGGELAFDNDICRSKTGVEVTEAEFDAMMAEEKSREPSVPQVGEMAPDFTAERLGEGRSRTGEYVTLSQLKGRPVALAFGSYT